MTVKIITDSTSDITAEEGAKLGITVIPLTVMFGREAYLDRVTITTEEFYRRLTTGNVFPFLPRCITSWPMRPTKSS